MTTLRRVLITGGAGFIGSFLADHFLATGYASVDIELQVADVRDRDAVQAALDGVDVVVHCAAAVGVAQSLYRVRHYLDANVGGTGALLQALAERRDRVARLVVLTSMTGYGEGLYR